MRIGAGTRLAVLLAAVLLLHMQGLEWLAGQLDQTPVLQPLPTPLFTRVLTPQAPAPLPAPAEIAAPPAQPRRSAVVAVASAPAPAASAPAAPASTPAPASTSASASVPEPIAPAPESPPIASSAPEGTATAALPAKDSWPADTRVNYSLSGNYRGELHGSARVQWQRADNAYQARVEIDLTLFVVVLTSQGEVTPQGLVPRAYEERQPNRVRGVRLGPEAITLNDNRNVPRPPGVQDTASQFVELSHRFSTGRDVLEVGRSVSFWMARPGGVDLWTYDIVEREVLPTPQFGPIEAFRLKPRPLANPRGNITAEMWFAPSLQYLPVRIKMIMGETFVDLMVEKIEQR